MKKKIMIFAYLHCVPEFGHKVVDQTEHLQLGKLISWTSMHSFPKWHESVRPWTNLFFPQPQK